jgi:hypothetical protein
MKIKWKNIIFLIIFVFLSLWVYPLILGISAAADLPLLSRSFLPRNKFAISATHLFSSVIGAMICAFVLAFPMGYLTKQQPKVLGASLGIIGTIVYFVLYPVWLQQFDWHVGTITIVEHVAFIVGCVLFTVLGCRAGNRRLGNS